MAVENGKRVTFHYTLSVDDKVVQTSQGQEPLSYVHGSGEIIPGLAAQLEGMNAGEEKMVMVAADDAYGYVDPNAIRQVPRSSLPAGLNPQKEMLLQVRMPDGKTIPARISEVRDESILIDMNHPLAGKDLKFDVKVVSIE